MVKIRIQQNDPKKIKIKTNSISIKIAEKVIAGGGTDPYTGEYEVTPHDYAQTLYTKEKFMTKNVAVFAIPYSEVQNPSGGYTINIGG